MQEASQLQIQSVQEASDRGGILIVRCVGGIARIGQTYTLDESALPEAQALHFTLDKIERYPEVFVDVFGPPHAARIHVSGDSPGSLNAGDIIVSESPDESTIEE